MGLGLGVFDSLGLAEVVTGVDEERVSEFGIGVLIECVEIT